MKSNSVLLASILTILALFTGYSLASGMESMHDGSKHHGMMGGMMKHSGMNYIFDELNISEDQQSQVQVIMQDFSEEMRVAMAGRQEPVTEEEHNEHHSILKDRLASVLSEEQLEGFDSYMAMHNKHRSSGHMDHEGKGECSQKGDGHMMGMHHMYNN